MFDMNPLNLPGVQLQHWIMLFVAGALGFIISYIDRQRLIQQLEDELAQTSRAVDDCHHSLTVEETTVLNRVRARASEVNFSRIGTASSTSTDDLKEIVGVGPFIEKKLHALGIYTFHQIAGFNQEDIEKVNDVIEFFPGRIERDNWVGQAAELAKKK